MKAVRLVSVAAIVVLGACSTGDGEGGTGGTGGSPPPPANVDRTCRDWCANEPEGFSCHEGPQESVEDCYRDCLRDYQEEEVRTQCGAEWIAIKDCQVELDCEDLFGDCDAAEDVHDQCVASGGTGGTGGMDGHPRPLVDNTRWVPSDKGEEHFGTPPQDSECILTPQDCPEFPWPEGDCVTFEPGSTCIASYVPECFGNFTVLAVYTRIPTDDGIPLCNWLTLEQPSLRGIRAGDEVEIRAVHFELTAPVSDGARMGLVIGDELAFDAMVPIPSQSQILSTTWTAAKDYVEGTPILWHVSNHGNNEYILIEVNVLE